VKNKSCTHILKLHQGTKQSDAVYLFCTASANAYHNIQTETLAKKYLREYFS